MIMTKTVGLTSGDPDSWMVCWLLKGLWRYLISARHSFAAACFSVLLWILFLFKVVDVRCSSDHLALNFSVLWLLHCWNIRAICVKFGCQKFNHWWPATPGNILHLQKLKRHVVQDLRYVGDAETRGTVHLPDSQGEPNCGFYFCSYFTIVVLIFVIK
jgi:hypothetical protein